MLVSFAYRFRQRPSGTGNNEPPASLIPERISPKGPRQQPQNYPANRRLTSLMRA